MVEKSRLGILKFFEISLLSKFFILRTKSVRHYKFQWWFHLPYVFMSRIHFIASHSTFHKFSLLWLKSQNVGALHTTRINRYFCHLHLLCPKPITITKYFILIHLVHREISCERWKLGFGIFHIPTAMRSGRAQALLRVFHTVA